ncbi:hypothetical protein [Paraburkholderia megapolitana]|uniref:hypothetical protein n=1 Tax=Paraburkholderia megapolitana TaxID=420953 RepID=UPI0038BA8751
MKTAIKTMIVLLASLVLSNRFISWAFTYTWLGKPSLWGSPFALIPVFGAFFLLALILVWFIGNYIANEEILLLIFVLGPSWFLVFMLAWLAGKYIAIPVYRSLKR